MAFFHLNHPVPFGQQGRDSDPQLPFNHEVSPACNAASWL